MLSRPTFSNFARALALACAFGGLAAAAQPEPPQQGADSGGWWTRALEAGRTAGAWIGDNLSPAAIKGRAADAGAAVSARWSDALAEAHADLQQSLGLFEVTSLDATGAARWERIASNRRLPDRALVLIHGLDDPGSIWDEAAPAFWLCRRTGVEPDAPCSFAVVRFDYPNDQSIRRSGDLLAQALRELRAAGVQRVDIVAHSMGGLVARDVLTRPEYYAGDTRATPQAPAVDRLIMLGTPNEGSHLARLRCVMELRDCVARFSADDADWTALLTGLVDGDGKAGVDLLPRSDFLQELNARPLPAPCAVTIVTGDFSSGLAGRLRTLIDAHSHRGWLIGATCSRLTCWLGAATDEFGDGAVPVWSVALGDIVDVVQVDADHRSMITRLEPIERVYQFFGGAEREPPAIAVVLDRLGLERAPLNP